MSFEMTDLAAGKRDNSWIWRPAVEPHAQNSVSSVRSSLVTAVREAALQLASDRANLSTVVRTLEEREWSVLRRIALDVTRLAAPKRSGLVSTRLTSRVLMYDVTLYHEYWNLLHDRSTDLTPRQKAQVLRAIDAGPPIYSDGPSYAVKAWQVAILAAIADNLAPTQRASFEQLVHEGRLRVHPEFQHYSESFVGPTSPLTDAEFAAMTDDELLEYLRTWVPAGRWGWDSAEGLGQLLERSVRSDPAHYSARAELLLICNRST